LHSDLHAHLLPGIDDGAPDLDTSMALIKALVELGFKELIATPHVMSGLYPNTRDTILSKRDEVLQAIDKEGIVLENFDAAAEYFIDETFAALLQKKPLLTLPGNRVLVEMSFHSPYPAFHQMVFDLQMKGYTPVLAHPERYPYFKNVEDYQRLREMGCQLQVNLLSLSGYYGRPIQVAAKKLADNQLIDFLATDMHHARHAENLRQALSSENVVNALKFNALT
jgi:tyrosine-protein phosphatase YwqE